MTRKVFAFLIGIAAGLGVFGQSTYLERSSPAPASAQLFFFDRTSNNDTERNWKIATLPLSSNATGDKILIELFGGSHGSTSTFQQTIHMGNRNAFKAYLRTSLGEPYTSVRIRAYEQTDGSVDVYFSLLTNGWKGASVRVYEGSGIVSTRLTIYENPTNVGPNPTGTLVFDSYTETPGIRLKNDGKLGIDNNSPSSKLHVGTQTSNSPSTIVQFGMSAPDSEARVLSLVNSGGGADQSTSIDFHNKSNWSPTGKIQLQQVGTSTGSKMHFHTYNSGIKNRMTIDQNGHLGIGTSSPSSRLTVQQSGSLAGKYDTSKAYLRVGDGTTDILFDGNEIYGNHVIAIGSSFSHDILFRNVSSSTYQDLMNIKASGNVGIGTNNPDEKLTVKGKIHSEEVRVDLSVPGPDYVFEPTYDLRTLEETEAYIKENKHLPEVPSAQEMEANGVQLGEMNMLLLKKIEELTLHTIQQQKLIEEQGMMIKRLNERLNEHSKSNKNE